MTVAQGAHLGHYAILAPLGAGGMGEVWLAEDTTLKRKVALKVLPAGVATDPERLARFQREAEAVAALSHPNIVTIFSVEQDGDIRFLTMEWVEGQSLNQVIPHGGLPLGQVLEIGATLADALAASHEKGIIHRDLKPANIMLAGRERRVKVLDFGLAKLREEAAADGETTTAALSGEGRILGTVAYMSPEQAEGKRVDARSDLFSLGIVFYELATGERPFKGETSISVLSAIVRDTPKSVTDLRADLPKEFARLIRQCLQKDPEERYQTAKDLRNQLRALKADLDSGEISPVASSARLAGGGAKARPGNWFRPGWVAAAAAAAILAATSVTWWLTRQPAPLGAPVLRQLTRDTGLTTDAALSPDGKMLAYASDRAGNGNLDIWVRQVGGGEPMRLTQDPANEREPAFSPDGTLIAYRSMKESGGLGWLTDGPIYVVSVLGGGPPRKIASAGQRPRFSPDGSQIAYWSGTFGGTTASFGARTDDNCRIFLVAASGGTPRRVRDDFLGAAYPEWAPDGQHLLFLGKREETLPVEESIDWWVTPLDQGPAIPTGALKATREEKLTGPSTVYPWALVPSAWDTQGRWLVSSARSGDSTNLWRIGISSRTWKATGRPERLTSSSAIEQGPSVASTAGGAVRIAFASVGENSDIWSLPIEAETGRVTGEPRRLTRDSAANFHPSLSADGRRLVFISTRSGHQEIWIKDLTTGEDTALTASREDKCCPSFSPDGTNVAFSAYQAGRWNHFLAPAGGGAAEMIGEDGGRADGWSPDGKYLIGNSVDGRLILIDVAARRRIDLLAIKGRWLQGLGFSPDGRWINFWESGPPIRWFRAPFEGATMAPESTWSDIAGFWVVSPGGSLSYDTSDRDGFDCVWAQRLDRATERAVGAPIPIYHAHGARLSVGGIAIGRGRLILTLSERTGNIWMAEWTGHW